MTTLVPEDDAVVFENGDDVNPSLDRTKMLRVAPHEALVCWHERAKERKRDAFERRDFETLTRAIQREAEIRAERHRRVRQRENAVCDARRVTCDDDSNGTATKLTLFSMDC